MALAVFFCIGLITCVLLNLLVVVVLLKKGRERSYMDLLMVSLSTSDILQAGIGYSVEIHAYYHNGLSSSKLWCQIAGFSTTFLGLVSISHLAGIALQRYVVVTYPMKIRVSLEHPTISLYVIVPSWLYGLLWALCPLLGWNAYTSHKGMVCGIDLVSTDLASTSYTYSLLVWGFLLPVLIITFCCYSIYGKLRRRRSRGQSLNMGERVIDRRKRLERQQSKMSLVLIGAFLFSWSPYACCVLVTAARMSVPDQLLTVASLFAKTSTLYNPIIYCLFVQDVRVRCRMLFVCCWRKGKGLLVSGEEKLVRCMVRQRVRPATASFLQHSDIEKFSVNSELLERIKIFVEKLELKSTDC